MSILQVGRDMESLIRLMNIHCVHKKTWKFIFFAISQLLLGQIQKVRSVLKTACSEDFKTILSLLLIFDLDEAEKIEVKDTKGHFHHRKVC